MVHYHETTEALYKSMTMAEIERIYKSLLPISNFEHYLIDLEDQVIRWSIKDGFLAQLDAYWAMYELEVDLFDFMDEYFIDRYEDCEECYDLIPDFIKDVVIPKEIYKLKIVDNAILPKL